MTILDKMIEIQEQSNCAFMYEHYRKRVRCGEFYCYRLMGLESPKYKNLVGDILSRHTNEQVSIDLNVNGTFVIKLFLREHPSELKDLEVLER